MQAGPVAVTLGASCRVEPGHLPGLHEPDALPPHQRHACHPRDNEPESTTVSAGCQAASYPGNSSTTSADGPPGEEERIGFSMDLTLPAGIRSAAPSWRRTV